MFNYVWIPLLSLIIMIGCFLVTLYMLSLLNLTKIYIIGVHKRCVQSADSNEVTINACLDYLYILLYALHYILAIWCQVTNAIQLVVLVAAQKS